MAAEPGERTVLEESLALAGLVSHGGLALVAEVEGRLAAQLAVHRRQGRYEGHRGDLSITVARDDREQGLGRALVETAVDWSRAVRLGKLTLGVNDNYPFDNIGSFSVTVTYSCSLVTIAPAPGIADPCATEP